MPTSLPIEIEVRGDHVRKSFSRDLLTAHRAEAKFARECAAYRRFNARGTAFVPQLRDHDAQALWLDIEFVAGGRTLIDWLEDAPHNSFEPVITQLLYIDRYLYRNRINYLGGSPKDVLVAEDYSLHLIDFEYTWLDERFEDIICESMVHTRLARVSNVRNRDLFVATLASRQRETQSFARRKWTYAIAHRLRLGRRRRLVK